MIARIEGSYKQVLVGILICSALFRVLSSMYIGNEVFSLPGTFDQISYHNLALRLLGGHGFSFGELWWPITPAGEPTAHWSYLYTLYLAAAYSLTGNQPLIARIIQAVLVGILQPLFTFYIARRLFGIMTGLLAAALSAVYIYFIYYAANLMTESFYIVGILASLYLCIRLVDVSADDQPADKNQSYCLAILLGITLGIVVLLRQLFLLFIPFMFLWIWWAGKWSKAKPLFPRLSLTLVVVVLLVIPFTIYNFERFNRFVLLNTNAGYAFYWANHTIYGTEYQPILPEEMGTYPDLIPPELRHLDEAALDQALLKLGLQVVIDDPARYVLLSIDRIPHYFMFWPSRESSMLSNISRVGSFGVFLPFMLYGWILAMYRAYPEKKSSSSVRRMADFFTTPTAFLSMFIVIYSAIHILSWSLIRYRLPVDAIWLIFAASGIWDLIQRLISHQEQMDMPQSQAI